MYFSNWRMQSGDHEVKYDMQIFAERIEFCWIHLRGIGALENSLWGYDGQSIRVWLNALAIESQPHNPDAPEERVSVKENVNIPLDFYPLCESLKYLLFHLTISSVAVLMDKGIIIGAEHEIATRSNLPFVMFRHATSVSRTFDYIFSDSTFVVALVLASCLAGASGGSAGQGGCPLRFALSESYLLCTCIGDSATYRRRIGT